MLLNKKISFFTIIFTLIFTSCSINYSFTGASISPDIRTVSVDYFPNHALLVNPNLSQAITEALKDKFVNQTSLELVKEEGDLQFYGEIITYKTSPAAVQGDMASQTRLTIAVKVKFVNTKDPSQGYNKTFSGYTDFPADKSLSEIEDEAVSQILEKMINDIFNAAVSNW